MSVKKQPCDKVSGRIGPDVFEAVERIAEPTVPQAGVWYRSNSFR